MTRRGGFTLLEVMAALVVTGVVALLAYGTARAGFETGERLDRHQEIVESRSVVQALLLDALRHPPEAAGVDEMLFSLDDGATADGLPADAISFFSRGITPPLGASTTWTVSLTPTEGGIRFRAVPTGVSDLAPIDALVVGARGLDIRVLSRITGSEWSEQWDAGGRTPAAVSLTFLAESGAPVGAPLIVYAGLERLP